MSYLMNTVEPMDIEFVGAQGNCLVTKGMKYKRMLLDWFMDNGTTPWGYRPERLFESLGEVSPHIPNVIANQWSEQVTKRLCELTHMDKAFYSMSGSEAVECAIKIARKYHYDADGGKYTIYCYKGGFHGRTFGALAASSTPAKYHKDGFHPLPEGFEYFEFLEEINWNIAGGVLLETVFGNNDVRNHSIEFMVALTNNCQYYYVPLILDEIQCGYGRTGTFNAFDKYGIKPDILCLGKGIGAGVPTGVTLARGEFADVLTPGTHFSTFGGNPHSIIGVDYMLSRSAEALMNVATINNAIIHGLKQIKQGVTELRSVGTMIAIDCRGGEAKNVSRVALSHGLFIPTFRDNTIKLSPAFGTSKLELELGIAMLQESFKEVYS